MIFVESFSSFKKKDVINICDGNRLGFVTDFDFDSCTGRICSVTATLEPCFFSFLGKSEKTVIPWEKIEKIGDDIILVRLERRC